MDDISSNFREKNRLSNKVEDELNPEIVELVKLLARICAKRDYNKLLIAKNKEEGAEP